MTETVFHQLMKVRSEGLYNMFAVNDVQRRAYELGFYDLVIWIEDDKKRYVRFIMNGELPEGEENPSPSHPAPEPSPSLPQTDKKNTEENGNTEAAEEPGKEGLC